MAKSRNIAGITAKLTLNAAGFDSGLKKGERAAKRFASNMKAVAFGTMLGSIGTKAIDFAIGKAKKLASGTGDAFHRMREAVEQSENTGMATGEVIKLRRAYKDAGRDAEGLGKDVGKMQKSIVTAASGGADPFAAIGLSANELLKLDPAKQMEEIGDALLKIENPAIRSATALQIFGKGGIGMISVFDKMEGIRNAMTGVPELANQFGAAMAEADITIGHFPAKMDGFFTGFAAGVVGEVLPGLKQIDSYSFVKLGKNLGENVSYIFEYLKQPALYEGLAYKISSVFVKAGESLANGLISGIDAVKEYIGNMGLEDHLKGEKDKWEKIRDEKSAAGDKQGAREASRIWGAYDEQLNDLKKNGSFEAIWKKNFDENASQKSMSGDMSDKADELLEGVAMKAYQAVEDNSARAEEMTKPVFRGTDEEYDLAPKDTGRKDWKETQYEVNDWQKRGLSLDGSQTMKAGDKMLPIVQQIKDILNSIARSEKSPAF